MMVYTVKRGDSLYSIAEQYGTTAEKLASDNDLSRPGELVVGQTLVIQQPLVSYRVRRGDTLYSIARQFGVTTNTLWRNNHSLGGKDIVIPKTPIDIVSNETLFEREIEGGGYAYTNINEDTLRKTLPYLTYLTVFSYGVRNDGHLIDIEDEKIIELARSYGVAPVMHLSSLTESGHYSRELVSQIFNDEKVHENLLDDIEKVLREKRYEAIDVDFEYVEKQYSEDYVEFIKSLKSRLASLGIQTFVTLAPKYQAEQEGLLYEGHDYEELGKVADGVILMTYGWGYSQGEPQAIAPLDKVRQVVEYAVSVMPREKIFLGTPNYGYDWQLPFVEKQTTGEAISNWEAISRAWRKKAEIDFDENAKAPNYRYYDRIMGRPTEHTVWFEDARSVQDTMNLIDEFSLRGFFAWNIMRFFPSLWLVSNSSFPIRRYYK